MVRFASRKTRHHAVLSDDFERELTREVLRTELLRVRALILTGCIMMLLLTSIYLIDPGVVNRVWKRNPNARSDLLCPALLMWIL